MGEDFPSPGPGAALATLSRMDAHEHTGRRRSAHLSLRLAERDRAALEELARREDLSASDVARRAIRRELERTETREQRRA